MLPFLSGSQRYFSRQTSQGQNIMMETGVVFIENKRGKKDFAAVDSYQFCRVKSNGNTSKTTSV
jgi:hypothetical protein